MARSPNWIPACAEMMDQQRKSDSRKTRLSTAKLVKRFPFGERQCDLKAPLPNSPLSSQGRGQRVGQTASDNEVNVKSRSFIGGIIITKLDSSPATRTGLPSSSMLLSMITGDSLKRKFLTGCLMTPFSM